MRAPLRSAGAFGRAQRLRTPEQFAALTGERAHWRAARQWIAAAAQLSPETAAQTTEPETSAQLGGMVVASDPAGQVEVGVRFGFTVGRRQARRAVQRVMVKRVLREAARHGAQALCRRAGGRAVDLVLRLRSPLPDPTQMGLALLKRSLRAEADSLIAQLERYLDAGPPAARRGNVR
jgi:RNase P protein component